MNHFSRFIRIFVEMKYLLSYIIISVFILQSVGNTFFYLEYQYSIEAYKSVCENKDKPELKCQGKCQMKKQTEKFGFWENENQKNQKTPALKTVKNFDIFNDMHEFICCSFLDVKNNSKFHFTNTYQSNTNSHLHPPPEFI